ncbi:MAG: bifunctional nuclease family protein [Anaerolineae bacterium]|jgi:hypothetical protein|nr:bifunctional nuclease family protein [Anaerolineae bacterium]
MIEVEVDSIRVSLMNQLRIVILKDLHSDRFLPIFIGQFEAEAIMVELHAQAHPRPLTHDLLKAVISEMGGKVVYILVNDLHKETFYARVVIDIDGKKIEVDARPSDAIALAVRVRAPIFVNEAVMEKSAVEPEDNIELDALGLREAEEAPSPRPAPVEPTTERVDESKLSAFADFLNSLNLEDLDDDDRKK